MAVSKAISEFKIVGLISAPATPFDENGDLAVDKIEQYVQHLVDFSVENAFITGSVGEGLHMTPEERKTVMQAWVKYGKGKLQAVIAHVGGGNLRESIQIAKYAQEAGVNAVACVGPTYFKPERLEDYVEYMRQVAAATPDLPFYLYDIDFITGIKYDTNDFFHAAKDKIPNLRGVKHTSPNFTYMHNILVDHGDRFQVMLGSDELYLEGLSIGIETTVMTSYHGHILKRCKQAFDRGDMETARKEQGQVIKLCQIRNKYGLWGPNATKGPLKVFGMDLGQPRCPLAPHSERTVTDFKKDLESSGFFEWGTKL
jgi:N-acetylneuraminate lyase